MLEKEKYIEYKEKNDLESIAFEYWTEHREPNYKELTFEDFKIYLSQFLSRANGKIINTPQGVKAVEIGRVKEKILKFYNNKFGI